MNSLQNKQRLPEGWHLARFDEILKRVERKVILDDSTFYDCVGVRWYGLGAFVREKLLGMDITRKQQWIIKAGDIVYNKLFAWKGAFAVADSSVDGCIVSDKFPTYEANSAIINSQFLRYYFRTAGLAQQAQDLSKGAAAISKLTLNPPQFWDLTIPLPPLEEQHRIVARLEELSARIEAARGLRREAVEEAEKIESLATRAILMKLDNASAKPLRQLVILRGGGTPSKSNPSFWEGNIPWISPKDMKIRKINDAIDHISEEATQESSAKLIESGAVLIVVRGMILAHTVPSAVLGVPASINQDMKALVTDERLLPQYLCIVLWGLNHKLLELVEKSTHDTRKLETSKLLDFTIPIPSLSEQHHIVAYLDELRSKVDSLKQLQSETSAELDALLPSIFDKAFKGEL